MAVHTALTYVVTGGVFLAWLPVMAVLLAFTRPFDAERRIVGRFLRLGGVIIARSFPWWRVRVEGTWPADGRSYVVVANHVSNVDVPLLSHLPREMKWMVKVTGFRIPVLGWLLELAGDLPVHQGDPGAGAGTLRRAGGYLRRGMNVMVFPEGKRNGGRLLPFKSGAFRLAADAGAPVLPVAIFGTDDACPPGSFMLRPAVLTARILDPVEPPDSADPEARGRMRDEARRRIVEALEAQLGRGQGAGVSAVA